MDSLSVCIIFQKPSRNVSELIKICRSPDLEALKLLRVRSGKEVNFGLPTGNPSMRYFFLKEIKILFPGGKEIRTRKKGWSYFATE